MAPERALLAKPPFSTRAALDEWIDRNGLAHLARLSLEAAAGCVDAALWPELRAAGVGRRLLELASEETLAATAIPLHLQLLLGPFVWRFLESEREAAASARDNLGERLEPPADLRAHPLHALLIQLRRRIPESVAPRRLQALATDALRLDPSLPGFRFEDRHPWEALPRSAGGLLRPEARLFLAAGAARAECSCGGQSCVHILAAIDSALSWLQKPADDAFLASLRELSKAPWERTLALLESALEGENASRAGVELIWRMRVVEGAAVEVTPWLHKLGKKGQRAAGVRMTKRRLLLEHTARLSTEDARIASLLPEEEGAASRALLESLVDHPRLVLAAAADQRAEIERAMVGLVAEDRNGIVRLTAGIDGAALPPSVIERVRRGRPEELTFVFDGRRLTLLDVKPELRAALAVLHKEGDSFPAASLGALLASLSKWAKRMPISMPRSVMGESVAPGSLPVLRLAAQDNGAVHIEVLVRPLEGGPALVPGRGVKDLHLRRNDHAIHAVRDFVLEVAATQALIGALPLARAEPSEDQPFQFRFPNAHGALALLAACAERQPPPELEWVGLPLRALASRGAAALKVTVHRKGEWFGLLGGLSVEGERVELARLLDAVRRKERYVEIQGRTYVELDAALRGHLEALGDHVRLLGRALEVGPAAAQALRELERAGALLDADASWSAFAARAAAAAALCPAVPSALAAQLRSYQVAGFQWLVRLGSWGAGAVLADDMGLGKTVQALALLLERAPLGAALVVLPTSVAFNWTEEAARFAPTLRIAHYGEASNRQAVLDGLGPADVLLVSYGLLLRDRERLAGRPFATAVFDEAQQLKNATSQRFRAAKALQADFRVALSGTPIENHLGELWSLFHLVFPGLFGSWESFRSRFAAAIEKQLDPEAAPALARVIAPYLMRRTKAEVEPELPARTEVKVLVSLSAPEWRLYEDTRLAALSELETRRSKLREQERRVDVLAALTRLRLLASHPRLYDARSEIVSSKLERLMELAHELRAEGQRTLVFSQFTSHLALVREALDQGGIGYLYLDGQTPAKLRGELVREFQEGAAPLFLISLKAGGTGLNLTAASNVIHLDPWWNPAVEDQASDRAHRLGQTRPVTIYRLVALGTIEEQMLTLHARKRALVTNVFDGDGGPSKLSTDELMGFLRR